MEYLQGEELADRIVTHGPLELEDVVAIAEQAARALSEAHERGLVHRDVKPENLLLVRDADQPEGFTVKLIDFGLANPSDRSTDGDGQIAGTPSYMSPEYMTGTTPPNVLLDLWGLAATVFVAATGKLAFDGKSALDVYRRLVNDPPPVPSTVAPHLPASFDAWFARACARNPADRFQTATELASALRDAWSTAGTVGRASGIKKAAVFAPTEPDSATQLAELRRSQSRG
jgi:serine/threonine-protein kinase